MGQKYSYHVYERSSETNQYANEPSWSTDDEQNVFAFFKHEVMLHGIRHIAHRDAKCIYLYQGPFRIVRCERTDDGIVIDFRSEEALERFVDTIEKLPPSRWGLRRREFASQYETPEVLGFQVRYGRRTSGQSPPTTP